MMNDDKNFSSLYILIKKERHIEIQIMQNDNMQLTDGYATYNTYVYEKISNLDDCKNR